MRRAVADFDWTGPAGLGMLAGGAGLLVAGPVGGAAGVLGGVTVAARPTAVMVAASSALLLTAIFTVLEEPLNEANIAAFPVEHQLAELAGKVAAVLVLVSLVRVAVHARPGGFAQRAPVKPVDVPDVGLLDRFPTSSLAAFLAATLLVAFMLWQVGDHQWRWAAPPLAVLVVLLASTLILRRRLFSPGR